MNQRCGYKRVAHTCEGDDQNFHVESTINPPSFSLFPSLEKDEGNDQNAQITINLKSGIPVGTNGNGID